MGDVVKEGNNQKTVLTNEEEERIIQTFIQKTELEDLSVVVSYEEIKNKNYSFSAGQYFDVKIKHSDISNDEFKSILSSHQIELKGLMDKSKEINHNIQHGLDRLRYEEIK